MATLKALTGHQHPHTPDQDLYSFLLLGTSTPTQHLPLANSLCLNTAAATCIQAINPILRMANLRKTCTANVSVQQKTPATDGDEC